MARFAVLGIRVALGIALWVALCVTPSGTAQARPASTGWFAEGGLGRVMITDPGERFSIAFQAGAGVEYQLENRHYAVGLAADGFLLPQFDAIRAVDGRFYLRYTY